MHIFNRQADEEEGTRARRIYSEYNKSFDFHAENKAREARNWKFYSGINYGQWDAEAVRVLFDENRPVSTLNYIQKYVDTVLGSLKQNPYKAYFDPINPEEIIDFNAVQELYDFNAERGDWEKQKLLFMLSSLIHTGVMEMYQEFKHSEYGDVGLRALNPAHFTVDPYWSTDDILDCRFAFKESWMTTQDITRMFGKNAGRIKADNMALMQRGEDYGEDIPKIFDSGDGYADYRNSTYKVIEAAYMDEVEETEFNDMQEGQSINPSKSSKSSEQIQKDTKALEAAVRANPKRWKKVSRKRRICKLVTIVPGIDTGLILSEGTHPLQLGRLPYVIHSAKNLWGERQGIVDVLADAQTLLNKKESAITHWQSTAANGSHIVDADVFRDQDQRQDLIQNKNRSGKTFFADLDGKRVSDVIAEIPRGQYPTDMENGATRMRNFMEEASSAVAASTGQSEGANESGALFNSKKAQALVPLEVLSQGFKFRDNEVAEMFLYAGKQIYSGIPRRIKNRSTGESRIINPVQPDGSIYDSLDIIDRMDVVIRESDAGASKRQEKLARDVQLLQVTTTPSLKAAIEMNMIDNMDLEPEAYTLAKQSIANHVKLQDAQTQSQIQQLSQPPQPPQGQPQPTAKEVASSPGQGSIPDAAGISGQAGASNNTQSPSDFNR